MRKENKDTTKILIALGLALAIHLLLVFPALGASLEYLEDMIMNALVQIKTHLEPIAENSGTLIGDSNFAGIDGYTRDVVLPPRELPPWPLVPGNEWHLIDETGRTIAIRATKQEGPWVKIEGGPLKGWWKVAPGPTILRRSDDGSEEIAFDLSRGPGNSFISEAKLPCVEGSRVLASKDGDCWTIELSSRCHDAGLPRLQFCEAIGPTEIVIDSIMGWQIYRLYQYTVDGETRPLSRGTNQSIIPKKNCFKTTSGYVCAICSDIGSVSLCGDWYPSDGD